MSYYVLTVQGYHEDILCFEERHRLATFLDAIAKSANILEHETPNRRYMRYDVRIELTDEH